MKDLLVLLAAVLWGFYLLGFDQRTDDTGVEAALIVATSLALTLAAPRRAVAIALAVALPIAAASVMRSGRVDVAAVVLGIAFVGAGVGWMLRRSSLAAR